MVGKRVQESVAAAHTRNVAARRTAKRARRAEQSAPAAQTSTPPPASEGFVFVLPAGALARDVGGRGFCLAYAVFDQLRRLGADVPASPEVLMEACFDVLLKLSDETLDEKGLTRFAVEKLAKTTWYSRRNILQ
jgi:hypothetical protein